MQTILLVLRWMNFDIKALTEEKTFFLVDDVMIGIISFRFEKTLA